jgi:uncharacterized protein YuzE
VSDLDDAKWCVPYAIAEKKEAGMAAAKVVNPHKLIRILQALPRSARLPIRKIDHDPDADVLYLSFERPQKATDSQLREDGIIIHRHGRRIVGITVLEASTR